MNFYKKNFFSKKKFLITISKRLKDIWPVLSQSAPGSLFQKKFYLIFGNNFSFFTFCQIGIKIGPQEGGFLVRACGAF